MKFIEVQNSVFNISEISVIEKSLYDRIIIVSLNDGRPYSLDYYDEKFLSDFKHLTDFEKDNINVKNFEKDYNKLKEALLNYKEPTKIEDL